MKQMKYSISLFLVLLIMINSLTNLKTISGSSNFSNKILKYLNKRKQTYTNFNDTKKINNNDKNEDEINSSRRKEERKNLFVSSDDKLEKKIFNFFKTLNSNFNKNQTNKHDEFFHGTFVEENAKIFAKFAKSAKCIDRPTKTTFQNYTFYSSIKILRKGIFPYKAYIHLNRDINRVVISFGGPRNLSPLFYNRLYSEDFIWIPKHKILLENEFTEIYYNHLRKFLIRKLFRLKFEGIFDPEITFNGHGIGASLAIYSAFDLAKSGIIDYKQKRPIVYSFGALRIGDATLATQINKYVDVWRITKQTDYLTRSPVCFYCNTHKRWDCKVDYFYQYQKLYGNDKNIKLEESHSFHFDDAIYLNDKMPDPYDYSVTNQAELSRNVFEKAKKPYYYYGINYNSVFNPNSSYFKELIKKKDDFDFLFFNHVSDSSSSDKEKIGLKDFNYHFEKNADIIEEVNKDEITDTSISKLVKTNKDEGVEIEINAEDLKNINKENQKSKKQKEDQKKKKSRGINNIKISKRLIKYYNSLPKFFDAKEKKNSLKSKDIFIRYAKLNRYRRKMKLISSMRRDYSSIYTQDNFKNDKYLTNYVYFTPPIGRQIFYTKDGNYIQCKRTYFGASTCEVEYILPNHFYSTISHNNYLGIDFEDCEELI